MREWWRFVILPWLARRREKFEMAIAWALPKRVAMWAYIRVFAHGTAGEFEGTVVPEVPAMTVLQRWPT